MKFDTQLRPATETSWVVSYCGKTIPRWRTATILKIVILPYLSEKSSDFDEILYTAADFELDVRHVIKNEKVALDRLRVRQNIFLVLSAMCQEINKPSNPQVVVYSYGKKLTLMLKPFLKISEGELKIIFHLLFTYKKL